MKRFYNCTRVTMFFFILTGLQHKVNSQTKKVYSSEQIKNLIDADSLDKAALELKAQETFYINTKQYDSLSNLTYYYGRIAKEKGEANFIEKSKLALEQLKALTNHPNALYNAYSDMASITVQNGMHQASYDYNKLGLEAAKNSTEDRLNKMANRTYGLASTAYFMQNYSLAKKHGIEAFKINESNPNATATNIYSACNVVGLMLQNENKSDSALYYYNKGVKSLDKPNGSLSERYYYPAILAGNIGIIYMNKGEFAKSLKNQQDAIHRYKIFIDSSANRPDIDNIRYNYLASINDMGSNYVKLGQVERALQIFEYNYEKAKEYFPENSIQQIVFTNQLAQGKWVAHDNDEALDLINEAYEKLKKLPKGYAGYLTYGLGTKANILENFGRIEEAQKAYRESDSLYEAINPGKYSFDRLTKLREAAMFYSRNGYDKDANEASQRVLKVVTKTEENQSLETIKAYILMAAVKLNLNKNKKSIEWANKSLQTIEKNNAITNMDSIFWHELKIQSIYYKNRAHYNLIDTTDVKSVSEIYKKLKKPIDELNNNASKYASEIDKNEYIYKTKALLDFSMQIALQLYNLTKDKLYLDHIISMHESRVYNRIRSKLAIREDILFKDVPKQILEREKQLKDSLASMRSETDFDNKTAQNYTLKNKEWDEFLQNLKANHPKYYKLRHETIKQSLGNIQTNIPENTTVVRYFFIDLQPYAFVINSNTNSLHRLNSNDLLDQINALSSSSLNDTDTNVTLHQLYKQLWQPFEDKITTKKVIIIPDHELFNLSFETLTPNKVTTLDDFSKSCLLSKYTISYNYSLYLLDKNRNTVNYAKDFIAFAPEFNDQMKESYKIAITDSINMDKTYLKLLPQPFAADLAKEYSKLFNGTSFLNEKASKQIFKEQAKEHKIIHIGTHAESNNVSPELSRLIFAKNVDNALSSEDNSLYTYEIYNQNLSSNLAILTACETGKPSFQAGEGMISLAHAFNYAGSESILTSLWKIDEQSSANIIKNFYVHLKKGLPKDEALQQAKLDYLSTAKGRTQSPQYWAGLVLIGDTSPIELQTSSYLIYWLLGAALLLILITIFVKKKI